MFINQNGRIALAIGLDVVLCVDKTLEHREDDQSEVALDRQLNQGLADLSTETVTRLSIVYEPVRAIGSLGHHAPFNSLMRPTPSFGAGSRPRTGASQAIVRPARFYQSD